MFSIYVLWSNKINKRYIGSAEDVEKRLYEHNTGSNRFTKGGMPWILVYTEQYSTRSEAYRRERFLKSGVGCTWLNRHLLDLRKGARVA